MRHEKVHSNGIRRGFTDSDLKKFFKVIDNDKHHLAFSIMRYLGRRVSEVARLNLTDINLDTPQPTIRIVDAKSTRHRELYRAIPPALRIELVGYLKKHAEKISNSSGFLFYKPNGKSGHISPDNLRCRFRGYCMRAGIDDSHTSIKTAGGQQSKSGERKLHRLSTHSFRFRLGTLTAEKTKDPWLVKEVLGHQSIKSTEAYIQYTAKKVNDTILDMAEENEEERKPLKASGAILQTDMALFKEFLMFKQMKEQLQQP